MGTFNKTKRICVCDNYTPNEIRFSEQDEYCLVNRDWYGVKFYKAKSTALSALIRITAHRKYAFLIKNDGAIFVPEKTKENKLILTQKFETKDNEEYIVYLYNSTKGILIKNENNRNY